MLSLRSSTRLFCAKRLAYQRTVYSQASSDLKRVFSKIDDLKPRFIKRLKDAVAIPSVSSEPDRRNELFRMAQFIKSESEPLGVTLQQKELGLQDGVTTSKGEPIPLPPILQGTLKGSGSGKRILIYGHYDVQPANLEDGWSSDPFTLVEKPDGRLVGRGVTDDKGPVIAWINTIQAFKEAGVEIPVDLVFCIEGMEESGSEGLEDFIKQEKSKGFKGVDGICISDNYWVGIKQPVLTYGLRGVSYYSITISGPSEDLHSGLFGGTTYEPMIDLTHVLSRLVTPNGKILIPGIDEMVALLTPEESGLYDKITFTINDLKDALGNDTTIHETPKEALMSRWRYPALSIHGVEGAFSSPGAKTVIPAKVSGKFSIRTVPDIDLKKLDQLVFDHVEKSFASLNSKNKLKVELIHAGKWWVGDPNNWNFEAARKATETVWGVEPDMTREGGSIPIALTFEEELKKPVLLLPIGRGDDGAHSASEKLDTVNYIQGIKTMAAYLYYAGK
ncbi:uncharacterized protein SAPINGB_P005844 [Magnusiomyces paraingens]|uniref:Peptidase M20 dimerisation domain-containing protein n=1 Tax=Magnusiomyces paraingens TaxID=2606893 RepID=A0A5E8C8W2_9ASCO|nr:uncharacterized protein SAPINGB_P005844 [Saprochaete ingens]VVT57736.1 unnamed protein product [Saprochaete ingens]